MSHGNVTTHVGTCQTCGREHVDLFVARNPNRDGSPHYTCVDSFACFAAWQGLGSLTLA
jgi:hypothetical protein